MSNSTNAPRVWTAVELPKKRKAFIVLAGTIFAFNASLGTSLPSGASSNIAEAFDVTEDDPRMILLNSLYVLGFVFGPLFFGPLSEYVGRRPVLIATYLIYVLFTLACALSPNLEALLVFRFLCGVVGSVPNSVLGGLYSDIYDEPEQRGNAMALFIFTAIAGPMAGPLFSGFTVLISWHWVFYIATIVAGAGAPIIMMIPETYLPVLLGRVKGVSPQLNMEQSHQAKAQFSAKKTFLRPLSLLLREPIVSLTSIYLAVIYGVLFLFFQVYPIVFEGLYSLPSSVNGLAFIPMIFGSFLGFCLVLIYSSFHSKSLMAGQSWAWIEEYRRLPLGCVGAPMIVIALFWIGWASYSSIHPALPMMAGIPFGFGYMLVFTAMLNYLTDAYKEQSASAQSAASSTRAIMAVVLPFAADPMYSKLGIHWASSLLGFLALLLAFIPFAFIKYGKLIRQKSGLAV